MTDDERFMRLALEEARAAAAEGNQPFGAVIAADGELIARGRNLVRSGKDLTAHAEVVAIRDACRLPGTASLLGATLFTTCEPCLMCAGAIGWSGISRVVIGATWLDAPAYFGHPERGSLLSVAPAVSHPFQYVTGVLREECLALYQS